jgi:DNA-binding transcriptional MocR family regulator
MSPEAVTAERVYHDIRSMILSAQLPMGRQIIVHALASELGVSISPVRDALNRLVGRGLVQSQTGGGFGVVGFTAASAAALYSWELDITRCILSVCNDFRRLESPVVDLNHDRVSLMTIEKETLRFFTAFAECSPNPEHRNALSLACERLHPLRFHESVLPLRDVELHALWQTTLNGHRRKTLTAMSKYHRRRISRIDTIIKKAAF